MTTMTLEREPGCSNASCGKPLGFVERTEEACRRLFTGWVARGDVTADRLARVWLLLHPSQVSRWFRHRQRPDIASVVRTLDAGTLPRERGEEIPPLDPRMFRPTLSKCDTNRNGLPCEWHDAEIVIDEIAELLAMARRWRAVPGTDESVIREIGRAASEKGQQLSHILRHLGGEGAGTGI